MSDNIGLTLVKKANKKKVIEGDIINYSIDIINLGDITANNSILRDSLSEGIDFIKGTITINGIVKALEDPNSGINIGMVDAKESINVSLDAKVKDNVLSEIKNIATIEYECMIGEDSQMVKIVKESNEEIVKVITPNVRLEKSASTSIATIGDIITYKLVAKNIGEIDVFDVTIEDLLGADINLIEESLKIENISYGNVSILAGVNIGTLAIGESKVLTFEVEVVRKTDDYIENIAQGSYMFVIDVNEQKRIQSFSSNYSRVMIEKYKLAIEKKVNKTKVYLNDVITYSIELVNRGECHICNILIKDSFPQNIELVEESIRVDETSIGNVSLKNGIKIGGLKPNEVRIITYEAKVISGSSIGYIINEAFAIFDYKLSNGVTGNDKTEIVKVKCEVGIVSFKQKSINKELYIPENRLDIKEIEEVLANIEFIDSYTVKVNESISYEGQISTKSKLIVHGYMNILVSYISFEERSSVHLVDWKVPFSSFIMLPKSYVEGKEVEIFESVESIEYDLICPRYMLVDVNCLFIGVIKS